jgi:hypothetical protein
MRCISDLFYVAHRRLSLCAQETTYLEQHSVNFVSGDSFPSIFCICLLTPHACFPLSPISSFSREVSSDQRPPNQNLECSYIGCTPSVGEETRLRRIWLCRQRRVPVPKDQNVRTSKEFCRRCPWKWLAFASAPAGKCSQPTDDRKLMPIHDRSQGADG